VAARTGQLAGAIARKQNFAGSARPYYARDMPQDANHVVIEWVEDALMPVQESEECRKHNGSGEPHERRREQSRPERKACMPRQQVTTSAKPCQENGKAVDVQKMIEESAGIGLSVGTSLRSMSASTESRMAAMNS